MLPDEQDHWAKIHTQMLAGLAEISLHPAWDLASVLTHILDSTEAHGGALLMQDGPDKQACAEKNLPAEGQTLISTLQAAMEESNNQPVAGDWIVQPLLSSRVMVAIPLEENLRALVGYVVLLVSVHNPLIQRRGGTESWAKTLCGLLKVRQDLAQAQKRIEQMDVLYGVIRALSSTLELHDLLQDTMAVAAKVMEAEASTLMLLDPETDELVFEITHGSSEQELRQFRMPKDKGIAGWVLTENTPLIVNDPAEDARFNRSVDEKTGFHTCSILCVPMQIRGQAIGVLEVLNKKTASGFDTNDVRLLYALAGQAAIAIENARLYQSLREERDRIIQAQEDVRRELARNLHDGTVQLLAAIAMNVEHAKRLLRFAPDDLPTELDQMAELVRTATRQTRTLLFELRPIILETRGLVAALKSYVERLGEAGAGPTVEIRLDSDLPRLEPRVEKTIFAIVQEAVNNSRKHAHASEITISMVRINDELQVIVEDNGRGFDLVAVENEYAERDSLGLVNMKERAELIDGWLRIDTDVGRGTRVILQTPLPTESASASLQDEHARL
ncbi:MAG: GAF domain-containing sensor histidine kinase [Chloroflexi bacterium]|nr:GAF domain-containing sensor histidine kinase [Chloroflexota bacterium]